MTIPSLRDPIEKNLAFLHLRRKQPKGGEVLEMNGVYLSDVHSVLGPSGNGSFLPWPMGFVDREEKRRFCPIARRGWVHSICVEGLHRAQVALSG